MPQIVTSPFTFVGNTKLGAIYRPYVVVEVFSQARRKWQPIEMIIDSGADYTLLPRRYAYILGVDLSRCVTETALGVGGAESVYQYQRLKIRINTWETMVPVGFLERDDIPPLLGRLACLETVRLTFDRQNSVLELV